jgi:hypothetical protein
VNDRTAVYHDLAYKSGQSGSSEKLAESGTAERNDNPAYPALAEILAELNNGERLRTN